MEVDAKAGVGVRPNVRHPRTAEGNANLMAFESFIAM
jgi:hypothetical protein